MHWRINKLRSVLNASNHSGSINVLLFFFLAHLFYVSKLTVTLRKSSPFQIRKAVVQQPLAGFLVALYWQQSLCPYNIVNFTTHTFCCTSHKIWCKSKRPSFLLKYYLYILRSSCSWLYYSGIMTVCLLDTKCYLCLTLFFLFSFFSLP